ncbi:hypothetical protein PsorP6_000564 [Peronosclerospora sorghi]|uniref:Uncharacterized protein n=1 Tax=Peronosclerospora sorghi TaxID=230839 RepID=A0ACC0WW81_9STRA|nr:hypothetical protein PsorP6_000564 [Peronosclerospora sorghi]
MESIFCKEISTNLEKLLSQAAESVQMLEMYGKIPAHRDECDIKLNLAKHSSNADASSKGLTWASPGKKLSLMKNISNTKLEISTTLAPLIQHFDTTHIVKKDSTVNTYIF